MKSIIGKEEEIKIPTGSQIQPFFLKSEEAMKRFRRIKGQKGPAGRKERGFGLVLYCTARTDVRPVWFATSLSKLTV